MGWGTYAILVIFGAFILLLILNPNMSCFGKRVKSPFYPLLRKKHSERKPADDRLKPTEENGKPSGKPEKKKSSEKAEDYGFHLD